MTQRLYEPLSNLIITCREHASRPNKQFQSLQKHQYIGAFVKISFPDIDDTDNKEHIWVKVTTVKDGDHLTGIVDNHPVLNLGFDYGDTVSFLKTQIEDYLPQI